jgi:hypothetical protein
MLARAKDRLRRKHNGLSAQDIEALDDPRANDRGRLEIIEDRPGKEGLEGVAVGGLNVYLVVFPDGVVSVSEARDIEGSPVLIASLVYYTPVSLR